MKQAVSSLVQHSQQNGTVTADDVLRVCSEVEAALVLGLREKFVLSLSGSLSEQDKAWKCIQLVWRKLESVFSALSKLV